VTIINIEGPAPAQDTASALFGMPGLRVTEAEPEEDGTLTVWAVPDAPARCPGCGSPASGVHEHMAAAAKDVRCGGRRVRLRVHKRRLECHEPSCPVNTFTEPAPPLPPRCKVTPRLKDQAAADVTDRGVTPAGAGRYAGVAWHTAHDAFAGRADGILDAPLALVAHLGIDEHRRGKPRWTRDEETGEYRLLADRWHTCFSDLSGGQRMIGQVQGRTADDAAYWLALAPAAWRDAIQVACIDMCTIYLSAIRRMLPEAQVAVDLFHVVHLAVNTLGDVRRRAIRDKYGRRGRSGDPEYGIKNLLTRNLEHLSPEQFARVAGTLGKDAGGQQIAAAWIAKEKLRHALNLRARITGSAPCERQVRDRLFAFYDWCAQNDDIPELVSLARTISRWEDQIVCAVLSGVTNAASESYNRLAKLEARQAYSFRNPRNQQRRVQIACTRARRQPQARARTVTRTRTRTVTGRNHEPG
jgi:transposase